MVFWDTSALVKLYVVESDSKAFAVLAQRTYPLAISTWTTHEILCSLHRKELLQDLRSGGAEAIYRRILEQITTGSLHVITYTAAVAQRATQVIRNCYGARKPVAIRSLDALQLGSALAGGASEIVSADARMRAGAQIFHLPVFPSSLS
jgi:predicted nucleic acid-binding protein